MSRKDTHVAGGNHDQDQDQDRRVPSQEEYQAETETTRWVELEGVDGAFQVVEIPPLKLVKAMERHGVLGLVGGDNDAVQEAIREGRFGPFVDDIIVPNVRKPRVYWEDPDDVDPSEAFDLGALTTEDLVAVISGVAGQDAGDVADGMDDRFQG